MLSPPQLPTYLEPAATSKYCHSHSLFVNHICTHHHTHAPGHGLRPARGSSPAARPAPARPAKVEAYPPKMLVEAAEEEDCGNERKGKASGR